MANASQPPHRATRWARGSVVGLAVTLIALFYLTGLDRHLTLHGLKDLLAHYKDAARADLPLSLSLFFLTYVAATSLSLPVAFVLSLLGGALFGFWLGTGVCTLASTSGAILAFLGSRYVLRDAVRRWLGPRLALLDRGVQARWGVVSLLDPGDAVGAVLRRQPRHGPDGDATADVRAGQLAGPATDEVRAGERGHDAGAGGERCGRAVAGRTGVAAGVGADAVGTATAARAKCDGERQGRRCHRR